MPRKDQRPGHTVEGKRLFMDLIIIDLIHERAYVYGYDGELTMTIPDSAFQHILKTVENGEMNLKG